jgi:hypothetical protein
LMPRTRRLHQQAPRSLFTVHGKVYTSTTTSPPAAAALPHLCRVPRLLITRPHGLYLDLAVRCDYSSSGCTGSTAPMAWIRTRRLAAQLLVGSTSATPCAATTRLPVASAIHHLRCAPRLLITRSHMLRQPRRAPRVLVSRPQRLYLNCVARLGASARRVARRRLLHVHRASGCLDMSCGSLRGSSSTTSTTPRVRVPRHVKRLVTRLVALLVVDFFAYAVRLGTSRGSSSTTSPTPHVWVPRHVARLVTRLVVDYLAYATRPSASAYRAARHAARRAACCQLLRLRRAFGCLRTSRGSSHRSSSTTSPTPRVRVPRHVARLVTRLVVDYSVCRDFVLWPHWLYFSHTVRRDYLSRGNTGSTSSTPRAAATLSSGRIASTIHLD